MLVTTKPGERVNASSSTTVSNAPGRRSLISTGTAARIAGCHPVTVLRAIERGELPAVRLGGHGHYRIAREDFQSWLRPTMEDRP